MSAESESRESQAGEAVVCPKCLLANSPTAAFCVDCGAPIGMVAAVDPLQHIYAEGFAYRSAVDGPPNLIVLVGMWLIFAPIVFATPLLVFGDFIRAFSPRLLFLFLGACSAVVLFRSTKNYIVKSREAKDPKA
jgi:hypothetical protein